MKNKQTVKEIKDQIKIIDAALTRWAADRNKSGVQAMAQRKADLLAEMDKIDPDFRRDESIIKVNEILAKYPPKKKNVDGENRKPLKTTTKKQRNHGIY